MEERRTITLDLFGDMACFTRPEQKVERISYNVPTPSAIRGIVEAIYCKPIEFYYEINEIQVMNPIKKFEFTTNETKEKINVKNTNYINQIPKKGDHGITQRRNEYLKDVYYRVTITIVKRDDAPPSVNIISLYNQFMRRLNNGKCFHQPYFGTKECICHFSPPNLELKKTPIQQSEYFGYILYDTFKIDNITPLDTSKKNQDKVIDRTIFNCKMENGVIKIPPYKSNEVFHIVQGG